jgi:hypothetical protein
LSKKLSPAKLKSVYYTYLDILLKGLAPSVEQPVRRRVNRQGDGEK